VDDHADLSDIDFSDDYPDLSEIDFSILTIRWRQLALWEGDQFLGMQGMNIGITDQIITRWEYALLREYLQLEKTPGDSVMALSAFSQMWLFAVYEAMRLWRERFYKCRKWHDSGGLNKVIENLDCKDELHPSKRLKKRQLGRYRDDENFRNRIAREWALFETVYQTVELLRMNLAKHAAPGKESVVPRAPGYARINRHCGTLDFEVIDKDGAYLITNRRDVAEGLRAAFISLKASTVD